MRGIVRIVGLLFERWGRVFFNVPLYQGDGRKPGHSRIVLKECIYSVW